MSRKKKDNSNKVTQSGYKYNIESGGDCILYFEENQQSKDGTSFLAQKAVANHTPIVYRRELLDDGMNRLEQLYVGLHKQHRPIINQIMTRKEIESQNPLINTLSEYRLFQDRGNNSKYSDCVLQQCENIELTTIYQRTGFTMIDDGLVFLNGNRSVTRNGLTDKFFVSLTGQLANYGFVESKSPERYKSLLTRLPSINHPSLVYTGLGFVFLTPLNMILRNLGIEPNFIFYITGKSGVRKTSIATVFLNFFGCFPSNGTSPPASFFDTPNAVERKCAVTDSTLLLLDDRVPSNSPDIARAMANMEQRMMRHIGNRSARDRLNADSSSKPAYIPKGNVITTAEDACVNAGESGVARTIAVEVMPGQINLEGLSDIQSNNFHLNECMSEYIQFLINNWDDIENRLKDSFLHLRSKAQNGGHGRLAESAAHLQIGIISMCEWLMSINQLTVEQSDTIQETAWDIFIKLSAQHNTRITSETPVNMFISAIREMRDRGTIKIVDLDKVNTFNTTPSVCGFNDKSYYYFYPDGIYTEVRKFYSLQDRNFPVSLVALQKQLADANMLQVDKNQITKAKRLKNGKRPRMLWLKNEYLDDKED